MPVRLIPRHPDAVDPPLLLGQLWVTALANSAAQRVVHRGERAFSYAEIHQRMRRLAGVLSAAGVEPGDTVAIMDWDSHRYLECFFAIPMMGCVLHTVNVRLAPAQMAYTLAHAGAGTLIVHRDFLPLLPALREAAPNLRRVIVIDDGEPTDVVEGSLGEYEALLGAANDAFAFPEFDENAQATVFYTTGTTGAPKAVYFSHRQLVLHTLASAAWLGSAPAHGRLHREDVYMPITPMFHVHAWGLPYAATLLGLRQVYPGRYEPGRLLQLIRDQGVTFSHCVPTLLHMLLEHPDAATTDLSRLKMVIGGSALPQSLARRALERGIDVFTGYGMSETGPIQFINHLGSAEMDLDPDRQAELRSRTGRPVALCQARLLTDDGVDAAAGEPGELVLRGPWLTQGYLRDDERSAALWQGGWLHTGDLARHDADGVLRITDRLKDVIKCGGEWIASLEIEDLVARQPGVAEAAVIAVPDERWGERPLVLVVPTGPAVDPAAIEAAIEQAVRGGDLPPQARPQAVRLVESLDRTSVGKLDKKALRQRYGG